ncbi:MAG: type II toxin-antitoxin system RelE/ParE family toxin [Eggerthellaceae bacterium]|nr:type II toxin-antitoxin system RelE/ParE family toxin [Eggerthellaceae bacterium]
MHSDAERDKASCDCDDPSEEKMRVEVRIADEFVEGLAAVYSERVLDQIANILNLLQTSPEIGSTQVRPCLTELYGANLRKFPVSTFVIVYRFVGNVVDVLALVYGPTVH